MIFPKSKIQVQIIDGTNKHVTCGIIDEHSHIAISRGVNESSQSVTAEVSIGDVINPNDHNIYRQLSGGVTQFSYYTDLLILLVVSHTY